MRNWLVTILEKILYRLRWKSEIYDDDDAYELRAMCNYLREAQMNNCSLCRGLPSKRLVRRYGLQHGRSLTIWYVLERYIKLGESVE